MDEWNIQQANTESAIISLRKSFPDGFPKIINIPITEVEIKCTITSLKNKNSSGNDGLSNKMLKYVIIYPSYTSSLLKVLLYQTIFQKELKISNIKLQTHFSTDWIFINF